MAWTRVVLFSLVQSVRVVGIRGTVRSTPQVLFNAEQPHFLSRRSIHRIREQIGRLGIAGTSLGVESGQERSGRTITQIRLVSVREMGGASMGAFEALVELFAVHPQLPGEAPLTIRGTAPG